MTYATGLACPRTHLIYPATEQERDETIGIRETNITVGVHRIDLEDPKCIENAEGVAESVLREYSTKLLNWGGGLATSTFVLSQAVMNGSWSRS